MQDQKGFPRASSIKSEVSSINSSSNTIQSDAAKRFPQQPGSDCFQLLEAESVNRAAARRREAFAKRVRQHKDKKSHVNDLLKYRGLTSYDWSIPLKLLEEYTLRQVDGSEKPPHPRWVWSMKRPKLRQLHVDQIKKPSVWSESTFSLYIEDLANSRVEPLIQRQLYANKDTHSAAVGRRLERIINDPFMREILSTRAFSTAISFFYRINKLPQAMALLDYMDRLGMEIPTEIVTIMLQGAASSKDLHNFTHLLRLYIRRGVLPTASIWTALVRTVQSKQAQAVVLKSMRERNLLERVSTLRDIARIVVQSEIVEHLDNNFDLPSFLTYMDSQFGTDWLSVSAGNIILYEVGSRKPGPEAISALDTLQERGMVPDEVTLTTLLGICSRERDHHLAIEVLRRFGMEHQIKPSRLAYTILFRQAWRSRLYNFATVIWRSACIEGVTEFKIRDLVQKNLQRKTCKSKHQPKSKAHIWSISAGEVIIGINPSGDIANILFPSSNTTAKTWTLTKTKRRARALLFAEDLAAAGHYRLVDDMADLLLKALQLDQIWLKTDAWITKSSRWKRENALPVAVKKIQPQKMNKSSPKDHSPYQLNLPCSLPNRQMISKSSKETLFHSLKVGPRRVNAGAC